MVYILCLFCCSIPDNATPRERIIAIARYYCSAFHAARKVHICRSTVHCICSDCICCTCKFATMYWLPMKLLDLSFVSQRVPWQRSRTTQSWVNSSSATGTSPTDRGTCQTNSPRCLNRVPLYQSLWPA